MLIFVEAKKYFLKSPCRACQTLIKSEAYLTKLNQPMASLQLCNTTALNNLDTSLHRSMKCLLEFSAYSADICAFLNGDFP